MGIAEMFLEQIAKLDERLVISDWLNMDSRGLGEQ
jgi:hypothetical protein